MIGMLDGLHCTCMRLFHAMKYSLAFIVLTNVLCHVVGALRHSLQDRLSKSVSGRGRADEIYLKLRTSTG